MLEGERLQGLHIVVKGMGQHFEDEKMSLPFMTHASRYNKLSLFTASTLNIYVTKRVYRLELRLYYANVILAKRDSPQALTDFT